MLLAVFFDEGRTILIDNAAGAFGKRHIPLFLHRIPGFEECAAGDHGSAGDGRIMTFRFGFKMQAADDFFFFFFLPIIAGLGRELIDDRRLRQTPALTLEMPIRLIMQDRLDLVHIALGMDLIVFDRRQNQQGIR